MKQAKSLGFAALVLLTAAVFAACGGGGGGGGPLAPTVTTGSATSSYYDNAIVTGTVNPNGQATTAWFEYGTDNTLADNTATAAVDQGSGNSAVSISVNLSGLNGSTTYYYVMVAQNATGTTRGTIRSFITPDQPPYAETRGADIVSHSSVVLTGIVNPNGFATNAWFEYGTDPTLSSKTSTTPASQGSGISNILVSSDTITGLSPETTYYFTIVAQSSAGTVRGQIMPFTMPAIGYPLPDAGPDQNVYMKGGAGTTVVTLDASGSTDPGGSIASYAWTQVAGTNSVTLTGSSTANPTFVVPTLTYAQIKDDLVFQVVVTDNDGFSSTDNVVVSVNWGFFDDFLTNTLGNYTTGGTGAITWEDNKLKITNGASGVYRYFTRLFGFSDGQTSKNGKFSFKFRPTAVYSNGGIVVTLHESNNAVRYRLSTVDDDNYDKIVEKRWNVDNGVVTSPFNGTITAGQEYTVTITYDDDDVTFNAFGQIVTLSEEDTGARPIWFNITLVGIDGTFDEIKLERKP